MAVHRKHRQQKAAVGVAVDTGIARELTGRKRNRIFAYDQYLALLTEGTERPPAG